MAKLHQAYRLHANQYRISVIHWDELNFAIRAKADSPLHLRRQYEPPQVSTTIRVYPKSSEDGPPENDISGLNR